MSGSENADGDDVADPSRTATVRTRHDAPTLVRDALAPDNTDSMDARVDGDAIVCAIERETTGGLQSTVDDYLVNLRVADRLVERGEVHRCAIGGMKRRRPTEETQDRHDRDADQANRHTTDADTTHQT